MGSASIETVIEEAIALANQQKQPIRIFMGDRQYEVSHNSTLNEILCLFGQTGSDPPRN